MSVQRSFLQRAERKARETLSFSVHGKKNVAKRKPLEFTDALFAQEDVKRMHLPSTLWPDDAHVAFCLHIDDLCPVGPLPHDYGSVPGHGTCNLYEDLLKLFPEIKISIYAIAHARFMEAMQSNTKLASIDKYRIDDIDYLPWRRWVETLLKTGRVEIAAHGLHHIQNDVRDVLPAREFTFASKGKCVSSLREAKEIFANSGFSVAGFKPPGWSVGHNSNFALLQALAEDDFTYVCLSSMQSGLNWSRQRVSYCFPQNYQNLLNIPQNINLLWPWEKIKFTVDHIIERNGIIAPQLHSCAEGQWMDDGMGEHTFNTLKKLIDYVKEETEEEIWFATNKEIATWWNKQNLPV